jgi:hypothetical protein
MTIKQTEFSEQGELRARGTVETMWSRRHIIAWNDAHFTLRTRINYGRIDQTSGELP